MVRNGEIALRAAHLPADLFLFLLVCFLSGLGPCSFENLLNLARLGFCLRIELKLYESISQSILYIHLSKNNVIVKCLQLRRVH